MVIVLLRHFKQTQDFTTTIKIIKEGCEILYNSVLGYID